MTRKMKTFLSLTLAASLLLGGCGASYTGGETDAAVPPSPTPTPTPVPVVSDSESLHPAKEETVYVTADASGRPEKIEVEALLSGHPAGDIPDVAALTDIRNTEGEESWTVGENNTLLWQNLGADIRYKGSAKADAELPVTETVTYYLDGEEITPDALAGQSGHVKIVFSFENHTAETVDVVRKTRKAEGDDRFSVDLDLELGDEEAADSQKESDGSDADKKAAAALTDGASQLSDAVTKFREGFEEFRDDGVTELTDFVDKDLSGLADRALALQEADGRYHTWSGLAEGTEGSVRFIIETGEIKAEG